MLVIYNPAVPRTAKSGRDGTDRISQPPGKIAGKRKTRDCGISQRKSCSKIYFSVSKQLLRKTTSCTASFMRRVITFGTRYGKITLFLNTLSMRKSAYVMIFGCIDGRGFRRMQLKSRLIKLIHFELNWFILNPLNHTESAESHWISLNHVESVRITLQTFRIKDWKLKLTAHFWFYGTYSLSQFSSHGFAKLKTYVNLNSFKMF